jgi:hypothetical protein
MVEIRFAGTDTETLAVLARFNVPCAGGDEIRTIQQSPRRIQEPAA